MQDWCHLVQFHRKRDKIYPECAMYWLFWERQGARICFWFIRRGGNLERGSKMVAAAPPRRWRKLKGKTGHTILILLPFKELSQKPSNFYLHLIGQTVSYLRGCMRNVVFVAGQMIAFNKKIWGNLRKKDDGGSLGNKLAVCALVTKYSCQGA